MKQLYHVAIDPEYQDHNPDHHDRDHIYLVWLDDDDLAQMVRTHGRPCVLVGNGGLRITR